MKQPLKNGKISPMVKITEYFYIFSKLSTSLVLVALIIAMGYALINSYKDVDNVAINLELKYDSLKELTSKNDQELVKLDTKISSSDKKINEIKNLLEQNVLEPNEKNYKELIEKLFEQNVKLQDQINNISLSLKNNEFNDKISKLNNTKQTSSLVDLILIKYKNGESVKEEIVYLNNILPNKQVIFEKLNMLEEKKFYGFKNLKVEFEDSTRNYIKHKFEKTERGVILKFLLKFIDVKPNDLELFENEELNLIMNAKKLMEKEDISNSLNKIMQIDNYENYFSKWIDQSQIYLDFKNQIKKVI